ncbi:hypothetical protein Aperf_G00000012950 [Anoplocephala perfoliata]
MPTVPTALHSELMQKPVPMVQCGRKFQYVVLRREQVGVIALDDEILSIGGRTGTPVSVLQVDKVDTRHGNITSAVNQCRAHEVEPRLSVIESVIEFAYTGGIRINLLNVVRLYLLSQNLGCARLIAWCVDFMKSRIESLDLNEIWSVANVTANEELQGVCVRLVADNLWLHCRNKRFFTHTELDGLRALLADNEIRTMDVTSKLIAISSWMAASDFANERAERESEFENLLEDIDLSGLPRTFFTDLATKNIDMDLSDVCRKILLKKYKEMEERGKSATRTLSAHERQPPVPSSVPLDAQILYAYGDDIDSYRGILKTVPGMQGGRDYQFFVPRRDNVAVLVFNDDIFLIGGKTQTNVSVSQVDKVDTRSGNITSVQPMSCRRNGASAVVSGQSIIVFGGCDSTRNTTLSSCEEYDPSSDRWKSVPDMSIGRYGSGAAHIPGLGELVVGGYSRTDFNEGLSVAELLSSGDGNWRTIAPMLCSRRFPKPFFNLRFQRKIARLFWKCENIRGEGPFERMQMGADLQNGRHFLDQTVGRQLIKCGIEAGFDKFISFTCMSQIDIK